MPSPPELPLPSTRNPASPQPPPVSCPPSFHNRPAESFFRPVPLSVSRKLTTFLPPLSPANAMAPPPMPPASPTRQSQAVPSPPPPALVKPPTPPSTQPLLSSISPLSNLQPINKLRQSLVPATLPTPALNSSKDLLCLPKRPALERKIQKHQKKLRTKHQLLNVVSALRRQTTEVDMSTNHLLFPYRPTAATPLPLIYGYPSTDADLNYCLDDVPGLCTENFIKLRDSLAGALYKIRQAVSQACSRLEQMLIQQAVFCPVSLPAVNASFSALVSLYVRSRQAILLKYREYIRTRKWIENVASKQRRGCLTHQQNNRMRMWLFSNFNHPYPNTQEKRVLCEETGLDLLQVNNWMINSRSRFWKPLDDILTSSHMRRKFIEMEEHPVILRTENASFLQQSNAPAECLNSFIDEQESSLEKAVQNNPQYAVVSSVTVPDGTNRIEQLLSSDHHQQYNGATAPAAIPFSSPIDPPANNVHVDAWLTQPPWDEDIDVALNTGHTTQEPI